MTDVGAAWDSEDFFEEAPCGHLAASLDGVVRRVSRTMEAMCGFRAAELVGQRTFADLLTVSGRVYLETHLWPLVLNSGAFRGVALELAHADGHRVPVLVSATLIGPVGAPTGLRIAVFDATERRAYEQELLAARLRAEESEARARVLVRTLQETLLPPSTPNVDGLEIAAAYRPAGRGDEVGGDFYDVFQVGVDDWIVAVGDVTGKGVQAATVTALARYTMRAAAVPTPEPTAILSTLNDVLRQDDATSRWCTVVLARFTRQHDRWTVTSCHGGHPPGFHVDEQGHVTELGPPGSLLGAFDRLELHTNSRQLDAGDAVVLYTDGVTEARSPHGFFGEHRLRTTVTAHRGSAHGITYRLLDHVIQHQAGDSSDDIVIVTVHIPRPVER